DAWLQGQACLSAEIAGLELPEKCPLKARGFLFIGEKPALAPLDAEKPKESGSLGFHQAKPDEARPH
ncbi:MAG: hypothetical protein LBU69_01535, partial [Deltaproteobacteria bacterium]|nr:hypothetical protein [Deltaproteobacteria bacterium]